MVLGANLIVFAILIGSCAAQAQEKSKSSVGDGWTFNVAPYLWLAGMEGRSATLPPLPAAGVDVKFGDLLKNLNFGFMMVGEAHKGRWGGSFDFIYMKLTANGPPPAGLGLFAGTQLQARNLIFTLTGSYRAIDEDRFQVDLLAGARIWMVKTKLTLKGGLAPTISASRDETWVDPIIGIKGRVNLGSGFHLVAAGTVGGFGAAAKIDWGVFGGVGYRFKKWATAFVGYRHLAVDYRNGGFVYDVNMSGPVLGIVFRF